ncbi:MAG: DUF5683 domain-containing protein [Balneolaceae bacterium]|nr:DUF5683 domain-containing protein [Balneolaceae bacterium]
MKWVSLLLILLSALIFSDGFAQQSLFRSDYTLLKNRLEDSYSFENFQEQDTTDTSEEYPRPKSVLYKSLIIPGWGQIVNRQIWKVPIIYGMFAGVGVYTVYLNDQYKDYRAAYYNATHEDMRFGPTPEYLVGVNANQLQSTRNSYRNQRDFMFVVMGLAYGLNAIDAYIFAHMRSFDVSDDLSARTTIQPTLIAEGKPGVRFTFSLNKK